MIRAVLTLSVALVVLGATPADAGPVAAAISAVSTFFGSLSIVAQSLIRLGLGLALSALQRARIGEQEGSQSVQQTLAGGVNPDTFVVGTYATGGAFSCPHHTHGKSNGYMTMVFDLSGVPGVALEGMIVNGEAVTPRPDLIAGPNIWHDVSGNVDRYGMPIEEYMAQSNLAQAPVPAFEDGRLTFRPPDQTVTRVDAVLYVRLYGGDQTTADPDLRALYGADPDYPILADMIGRGRAYAIVTARGVVDRMDSVPDIRFVLRGIALYDPRRDTSVGGTGSQRYDSPSTWAWSDNPMVVIYNILRGIPVGPDIYGGVATEVELPLSSWFAAMNACDEMVSESGGPVRRYRCGYEISVDQPPFDAIEAIKATCAGDVVEVGGAFYAHVGAPAAPIYICSDEDLLISESQDETPFPGLENTVNGVSITHPSPAQNWEETETTVLRADLEAEDDGRRLVADLRLPACPYPVQAQRLGRAFVADGRRWRQHVVSLPPDAAFLRPFDVISWTSVRHGYVNKRFELQGGALDPITYATRWTLREVDPTDYDWSSSDQMPVEVAPVTRTQVAFAAPVVQFQGLVQSDSLGRPRRAAIWAFWDGLEAHDVQLRLRGQTSLTHKVSGASNDLGGVLFVDSILPGETYEGRGRVTPNRVDAAWSDWVEVVAPDIRLDVTDLADALRERIAIAFERHDETLAGIRDDLDQVFERQIVEAEQARKEIVQTGVTAAELIEDVSTVVEANRLAEVTARTQLIAAIDGNFADVTQLLGAKVDEDGAIAAVETRISAEFGSLQAMAQTVTFAGATVDGISAGYVLRLNGQGVFEVVSVDDGTSGPVTTALLDADLIRITGLTQIDDAVIENLVVDNAFIGNLTVGTSNIATNAVSVTRGTSFTFTDVIRNTADTTMVNVAVMTISGSWDGATVIGNFSFMGAANNGASTSTPRVQVLVGGVVIWEETSFSTGSGRSFAASIFRDNVSGSNIQVAIRAREVIMTNCRIWATGLKR